MTQLIHEWGWLCIMLPLFLSGTATIAQGGFEYPPREGTTVLVVPDNAEPFERLAAETLMYYLARITGVTPALETERDDLPVAGNIFVGRTRRGLAALGSLDDLPGDGFALRTDGGGLFLAGPLPIGTLNAAVGLVQDHLGVIWGMPNPLWHHVPTQERIALPALDERERPALAFRIASGLIDDISPDNPPISFQQGMRMSHASYLPRFAFRHNLHNIISEGEFAESNPEYFAYRVEEGRRLVGGQDSAYNAQPCLSNPDVLRITIEKARAAFDADPDLEAFSLCPNDHLLYCQCEGCAALDAPPRIWRDEPDYADSYYRFVEQVALEVAKTHPGRYLTTYAYWGTVIPPRIVDRLPDNVHVALTQDVAQHFDPNYRDQDLAMLDDWLAKTETLSVYVYWNLGLLFPRYYPHQAADYIRAVVERGVYGWYSEAYPLWVFHGPMIHTGLRQVWDPSLDTDELLTAYMDAFFGDQADTMASFYDTLMAYWTQPRDGRWFQGLDNMIDEYRLANVDLMRDAMRILYRARMATQDPLVAQRLDWMIERARLPMLLLENWAELDGWAIEHAPPHPIHEDEAAQAAQRIVQRDREIAWLMASVFPRDRMHHHTYLYTSRAWIKLWWSFQRTQDALMRAVVDASTVGRWHASPTAPWAEAMPWLESLRLDVDLTFPRRMGRLGVWDAADMLSFAYPARHLTPIVDGDLTDWRGMDFRPLTYTGEEWSDQEAQAHAALVWDNDHLYLAVRVRDAIHLQSHADGEMWREDSVQLAIDPLRRDFDRRVRAYYAKEDREFGFALPEEGPLAWDYRGETPGRMTDAAVAVRHHDGMTVYEASIPWARITADGKPPEGLIGVNVVANDSDGQGRSARAWTPGTIENKDPRPFANVWLMP